MKIYSDERINELIKKSFEIAVKDEEWEVRFLNEWNILFENIDKILAYVENGKQGKLFVNSNIWWVLQETLMKILDLYDLKLIGADKVTEEEEVVSKKSKCNCGLKCNLCDEDMTHYNYNGTFIWTCNHCPNIQFEFYNMTDVMELENFLHKNNKKDLEIL